MLYYIVFLVIYYTDFGSILLGPAGQDQLGNALSKGGVAAIKSVELYLEKY